MARLTPLGTSGWMPTKTRDTMCWLLEVDQEAILFDLGSGFRKLSPIHGEDLLAPYERVTIFMSHFHLDHVAAVPYLAPVLQKKKVTLIAPGEKVTGFKAIEVLDRLTSSPLFSLSFSKYPIDITVIETEEGRVANPTGLSVTARVQTHSEPTLAYRIEDILTYATDTICDDETIEFARGCSCLIHECWFDREDYSEILEKGHRDINSHSHEEGVLRIAQAAEVKRLIPAHFNPMYPEERVAKMVRRMGQEFEGTVMPIELESITLSD